VSIAPEAPLSDDVAVLRDVTVRFGAHEAVRGLTLTVRRGETLVLLGRSGSGKTTTLKLINGLRAPASGEVSAFGRPTRDWEPHRLRRKIGYVIQDVGLLPHWTVERNIALVPELEGWDAPRRRARAEELLRLVGLEPALFRDRRPRELSGGQRQRVGIARALAADPPLLLLDEPFGALDPLTRADLQREFATLRSRLGTTAVFVTHDVREAMRLATRIALFANGQVVFLGSPDGFRSAPHPEARAFAAALDA
jgi:osmoprotectant transport system ATP-binding protein